MDDAAEVKDPAVAVQLVRLATQLKSLLDTAQVQAQAARDLSNEVRQLSNMAHTTRANDESIKRLWAEIESRDKKWDTRLGAMAEAGSATRDRVNRIYWMVSGASLVVGVAVGLLIFIGNQQITSTDNNIRELRASDARMDDRMDRVEIHLAGDTERPYRR